MQVGDLVVVTSGQFKGQIGTLKKKGLTSQVEFEEGGKTKGIIFSSLKKHVPVDPLSPTDGKERRWRGEDMIADA